MADMNGYVSKLPESYCPAGIERSCGRLSSAISDKDMLEQYNLVWFEILKIECMTMAAIRAIAEKDEPRAG